MSHMASFYLIKNGRRQELSNGNCSGEVYIAIWDWCEGELDIDGRFNAPQTEDILDCVLFNKEMAALHKQNLPQLAAEIGPDWDLPADAVQRGLKTLCSHLEKVQDSTVLLYEMIE